MNRNGVFKFFESRFPRLFYKLLKINRSRIERKKEALSLEDIKADDDRTYYEKIGKHVNWENPRAYTEKMQLEKLYHNYPLKTMLADKYRVRAWVAEKIGEKYLVPLCEKGVFNSPYEIVFSSLPNAFVIKTNSY